MNLMRGAKLVFVLGVLCSLLMSCEERPRIYTREDFIDRALELATFLTDNYEIGDSILFKTERGDTAFFYVRINSFEERVFYPELEEDGMIPTLQHDGYDIQTYLKSLDDNEQLMVRFVHGPNSNKRIPVAIVDCMDHDIYAPYEWKETDDTIFISDGDMTCTLKKNVGIVKITCDEHSWELVQ